MSSPSPVPHIPGHVVWTHILPHLGIDVRLAFRVPPRKLDLAPFARLDRMLRRRARSVWHSAGAGLSWANVRVPCTDKVLVYRYHHLGADEWRAWDLVNPWGCTTLWAD